jgi:polyisoprenyl-teichoic acid--peptidoglycan teichoic acid transferase
MATGDKPYRVYRGGRVKGKVPGIPRPERDGRRSQRPVLPPEPGKKRLRRRTAILLGILLVLVLAAAWLVVGYLQVRKGVAAANERLDPAARTALSDRGGLLLNQPTTIALFGTDHAASIAERASARRADSIVLLRTDPQHNRLAYLSIPRDLRVDIPGHSASKINTAFQVGGPGLALRTVRNFTGIPIDHVVVVDFADFTQLVDAVGGITVDNPKPILSNRFDCPYPTQERCQQWEGWRFRKGEIELDGYHALIYSRVRENRLDPGETDITRGERQQRVLQAITSKVASVSTVARLPFVGDDLARPLATDLSTWQLMQLGWRRLRADGARTLHCRLGGEPSSYGGESILVPSEDNRNVISMFLGASAPQPPVRGLPFAPGCTVGDGSR